MPASVVQITPVLMASVTPCYVHFYSLTTKSEYHYKGHEPYRELIHTLYTLFNTLPLALSYTLDNIDPMHSYRYKLHIHVHAYMAQQCTHKSYM